MRVIPDRERCCGTGMCVSVSPGYFGLDPADRRVRVLRDSVAPEDADEVTEATEMCPTSALRLE